MSRYSILNLCPQVCGKVKSTLEYATVICSQYSERVRRLSGLGMQLSAAVGETVELLSKSAVDVSQVASGPMYHCRPSLRKLKTLSRIINLYIFQILFYTKGGGGG